MRVCVLLRTSAFGEAPCAVCGVSDKGGVGRAPRAAVDALPMLLDRSCRVMVITRVDASRKWPRFRSFHHSSTAARTAP
eukprot:5173847-Prymnesium_polylepis.1